LWPVGTQEDQPNTAAPTNRPSTINGSLKDLESDSRMHGCVTARECSHKADAEMCLLAQASQPLHKVPASALAGPLGCLNSVLGEVCEGKVRSAFAVCPLPYASLQSRGALGGLKKPGVASATLSLLAVALMQARSQHLWLRKIAIVDCSSATSDIHTRIAAHSAMMLDTDVLILAPLAAPPLAHATESAAPVGRGGKAKADAAPQASQEERFNEASKKITDFAPQLVVCLLDNTVAAPGDSGAQECEVDGEWLGRWAGGVAATCCYGRIVTVCGSREAMPQFLVGILQA
jgi:hypothetical protein